MPDEKTTPPSPALPDLHPGNVAPFLCKRLGVPGVIVLLSHENGVIQTLAHNVTHERANEMLSRGVQINLNQHDEAISRGLAGEHMRALQEQIRADRGEEVLQ